MKDHAIAFVLVLLLNQWSFSQNYSFSVYADPQLSWFNSDTKRYDPNGAIGGLNIGFTAEKFFARRYAFATGLSINSLGGNIRFVQSAYTLKTIDGSYSIDIGDNLKFRSQYLTLPFGFKFRTNQIGFTSYFANVGVSGSLRIRSHVWNEKNDVVRETTKADLAWGFASYFIGVGGEYSLGGESALQYGLIWSDGLTPVLELPNSNITNQCLSVRIGVVF